MSARRHSPAKPEHGRAAGRRSNSTHTCGDGVYLLHKRSIDDLRHAQRRLRRRDVGPYLELKELLDSSRKGGRARFCSLFAHYYGLNAAHRSRQFKERFFQILHRTKNPNHAAVIRELHEVDTRRMEFSFVSKLVAMRDESSPIVDKHVLRFFKTGLPPAPMNERERIKLYEGLLSDIKTSYVQWAKSRSVKATLNRLKKLDRRLSQCHSVRLIDFLVLEVGRERQRTKRRRHSTV